MLYYRCPSCRTILGNKQIPFEEGIKKICDDINLSEKEKDQSKADLLNELYVINPCCRMRILSYIKKVEIVK